MRVPVIKFPLFHIHGNCISNPMVVVEILSGMTRAVNHVNACFFVCYHATNIYRSKLTKYETIDDFKCFNNHKRPKTYNWKYLEIYQLQDKKDSKYFKAHFFVKYGKDYKLFNLTG